MRELVILLVASKAVLLTVLGVLISAYAIHWVTSPPLVPMENVREAILMGYRTRMIVGCGVTLLLCASIAYAQEVARLPDHPMDGSIKAILIVSGAGILTTVMTQLFTLLKLYQHRRWDLQDRAEARAITNINAQTQYAATIDTAIKVTKVNLEQHAALGRLMEENTTLTKAAANDAAAAFNAANDFNKKLKELREELARAAPDRTISVEKE